MKKARKEQLKELRVESRGLLYGHFVDHDFLVFFAFIFPY